MMNVKELRSMPPKGQDWCPHGCQPLFGLGECGMCGYQGEGVWSDETYTFTDACEETGRYTRQTPEGYCYACGTTHEDKKGRPRYAAHP